MRRVLTAGDQLYPTSSVNIWCNIDDNRIHQSQRQATDSCKITRKNKRAEKVKQLDAFKNQEGEMYKSGHFHITSTSSKARRAPVCKVNSQGKDIPEGPVLNRYMYLPLQLLHLLPQPTHLSLSFHLQLSQVQLYPLQTLLHNGITSSRYWTRGGSAHK